MKEILNYIKEYHKETYHKWLYLYIAIFLIITISINYSIGFEDNILDVHFGKPIGILFYSFFYAFAYYGTLIPQQIINGRVEALKSTKFWLKSVLFLSLIGFAAGFYHYRDIVKLFVDQHEYYYLVKLSANAKEVVPITLLFIIKYLIDRDLKGLYGFHFNNINVKPYLKLLSFMVPLIFLASFLPDFQQQYPQFKPWQVNEVFGMDKKTMQLVYEFFYSLSFLQVELLFRGALVIGMVSVLGKDVVLPMVVTYAFLHFGKPLGETIGSIFGGYILGIIALRTRHIFGGYIIHVGVALLMEVAALYQYYK